MLRLAICDDSPNAVEQIEKYIDIIKDIRIEYDVFFRPDELEHYKYTQQIEYDIYILDIEMGDINGLQLAKKLRNASPYSLIIFLTSYSEYVYDVFNVVTFDFIIKPLTFERFYYTLHKAAEYLGMAKVVFTFTYRKNSYSIPCQSISYIEKEGRKAYIHTNGDKIYQCNLTLSEIWEKLNAKMFSPIHISCIVNLAEIIKIERDELTLKSGELLYIGRNYRQEIKLRHLKFLREQL